METEQKNLDTIFCEAVEISSDDERRDYLDRVCGDDTTLRSEAERLISDHFEAGDFLEKPAVVLDPTLDQPITERPGTVIGRYKLLEQIGEGGFGVVFMAEQEEPVRRKVALKIIKPGMDTKEVIARFEAERQALAIMDHPNIAKVLDAGATESGRPFFVMELVRGIPITAFCDQNSLPTRNRLELFTAICQAVQHAHQKGIIHRDIKPSNVMVTLRDDTPVPKVIDFGVAKATNARLTEQTLFTRFGQMVGTPLYMSPEQTGMSELDIDTRSDIYSLGVLLYELLTGTTPFDQQRVREAAFDELLKIIREEDPPRPSLRISTLGDTLPSVAAHRKSEPKKLSAHVRGELDWIVMKALEKDRTRRYETANSFASDIQRYLADEPVEACPPSAAYRFKKFARRNKASLTVAGLILLFLVLLGSGIGWTVRDREAREQEIAHEKEAREQEIAHEREARQARTASQIELILEEVERLEQEQKWPEALAAANRAVAVLACAETNTELDKRVRQAVAELTLVSRLDEARMVRADTTVRNFDCAGADRAYCQAFAEAGLQIDELTVQQAAARLGTTSRIAMQVAAGLTDWWGNRRVAGKNYDDPSVLHLLAVADALDPDPWRSRMRAILRQKNETCRKAFQELAASAPLQQLPPATLDVLARGLASPDAAVELLRTAQDQHPNDFWLSFDLAYFLQHLKPPRLQESIAFYRVALALRPRNAQVRGNLGLALEDQGKLDEAIACYRTAIELGPTNATSYINLGFALQDQGKLDEAIACDRTAIELDPKGATAHNNLGVALKAQGKLDEAITCYRTAIELDPKNVQTHNNLGVALQDQGKLDEAIACFRTAIELDPKLAKAHNNLGFALKDQGKLDEAIACYRTAIELDPKNVAAHNNLGVVLVTQRKLDEAIACFRTAIELDPKDVQAHYNLGLALKAEGKLDEAIACYRTAIKFDPKNVVAHNNLGFTLQDQGKLDEAIACFRTAIELDPKLAKAHHNLGFALKDQGKLDEAIACYRTAIELDPKYVAAHNNLGLVLQHQRKLDEAIACYRTAIELDPKYATAHHNLGSALQDQGKLDEAIACYRTAIELDPKYATAHHNLGSALQDQGKLDEAIACYRTAIELDPKNVAAHHNLGSALKAQGKLDEAIACYRTAIELDPKNVVAHHSLGLALKAQGKPIACYRTAIELDPKNVVAHHSLGLALKAQGKLDEAIACYRTAIELDPTYAPAHNNLGFALEAQGKLDEAIDCYRTAIELDPTFAAALGLALQAQGKLDEAIACFRTAIELIPKNATARNYLGLALQAQGKLDEAITCYRTAIELDPTYAAAHTNLGSALHSEGKPDEAIACFRTAIELDPTYAPAHNNLGNALRHQGKLDEAVAHCRKAIELDPKLAEAHSNLGNALKDQGKLNEAIACFRTAIELDPKYATAHNNLGVVLGDQGKLDEAIAHCRKAIELDPKLAEAHSNLGNALKDQGKLDEAIACFRTAIELDPKLAGAHHSLGLALQDQGKLDEAIACYRKAIELDPKYASAYNNLGVALKYQGKLAEAVAAYDQAIRLDPNVRELCARAGIHAMLGKYDQAAADARRAVEITPTDRLGWLMLLDIEFSRGGSPETTQAIVKESEAALGGPSNMLVQHAAWNLLLDRRVEYERICRDALARFGKSTAPPKLCHVARAAALTNKPVVATKQLVEMFSRGFGANSPAWGQCGLGLCLLRDGQEEAAIERFNQSLGRNWKEEPLSWLGLAIAHAKRGRIGPARDWLRKAQAWFDQHPLNLTSEMFPNARIGCQLLLREAEQLLRESQATVGDAGKEQNAGVAKPESQNGGAESSNPREPKPPSKVKAQQNLEQDQSK